MTVRWYDRSSEGRPRRRGLITQSVPSRQTKSQGKHLSRQALCYDVRSARSGSPKIGGRIEDRIKR
eukprot:15436468-Alexandrium_andersonii.AAC.1